MRLVKCSLGMVFSRYMVFSSFIVISMLQCQLTEKEGQQVIEKALGEELDNAGAGPHLPPPLS